MDVRGHVVASLILALAMADPSAAAPSRTVVLRDGRVLTTAGLTCDGTVVGTDGGSFPTSLVDEVYLVERGVAASRGTQDAAAASATTTEQARCASWYDASTDLQAAYPGSDGVILLDEAVYTVEADGSYRRTYHGVVHILGDGLVRDFTAMRGYIEEGRSRYRFDDVTVYHRDGRCFRFDPSRVAVTEQQDADRFFSGGKITSYPVSGVARDCIIDYTTTSESYNPFRPDFFFPRWGFRSEQPVALSRVVFDLPAGMNFPFSLYNVDGQAPVVEESFAGGRRRLTMTMTDVPPYVAESGSVQYDDVTPFVRGARFADWQPIFDFLYDLQEPHLAVTPELEAFTKNLVKSCPDDRAKVARVYHWLQEDIRYIAIKMGVASGWGGFPAAQTFKKRLGCCIDKALLFSAMLRVLGIWSSPVVLMTNGEADVKWNLPQIGFNHAISVVRLGGEEIFLDSTGSNCRFPSHSPGNVGVKAIIVLEKRIAEIPVPKPEDNGALYDYRMDVGADGGVAVAWVPSYSGAKESALRGYYKQIKENDRRRIMESIVTADHPSARVRDFAFHNLYELSKPFSFTIDYDMPGYVRAVGPLRILPLPSLRMEFPETGLRIREYPLEHSTSRLERRTYRISIPEGWRVRHLPEQVHLEDAAASYDLTVSREGERELVVVSSFARWGRTIPPHLWPDHRDFLTRVAAATDQKIFLEVTK